MRTTRRRALLGLALVGLAASGWAAVEEHAGARLLIVGRAVWPGLGWFPGGDAVAARDARFADQVASSPLNGDGSFALLVEPGEYYLMVHADLNADGKVNEPDGLGFHGVAAPSDKPAKLRVAEDDEADVVAVTIAFQLGPGGKLRSAVLGAEAGAATLRGKLTGAPEGSRAFVVAWPAADGWYGYAAPVTADGAFVLRPMAGEYVLVAFADRDGRWGPADAAGLLLGDQGPRTLTLLPQSELDVGDLGLAGVWADSKTVTIGESKWQLPLAAFPAVVDIALDAADDAECPRALSLFADAAMKSLVAVAWDLPGTWLALRPATYAIVCGLDLGRDGSLGPGDRLASPAGLPEGERLIAIEAGRLGELAFSASVPLSPGAVAPAKDGKQP